MSYHFSGPSSSAILRYQHLPGHAVFQLLHNRDNIPTNGVQLVNQMTLAKEDLREYIHLALHLT